MPEPMTPKVQLKIQKGISILAEAVHNVKDTGLDISMRLALHKGSTTMPNTRDKKAQG